MLRVYNSNQQEELFQQLCRVLAQPLTDPLQAETILVQSQGMAHWLSLALAQRFGIAANLDFPFPASYVWRIYRQQYKDIPEVSRFDKPALRWRVLALLPHCIERSGFEVLQGYLQDDGNGLKAYQLAQRVADIFDQYLIYRPDWLLDWESGQDDHWQALLWRELTAGEDEPHRARLHQRFMQDLQRGRINTEGLPPRICLFGISALPQTYLDVLAGLSVVTEVYLFMQNPSLAYWGDIVSEKDLARLARRLPEKRAAALQLFEVGNNLLASLGKQGHDFHEQLQGLGGVLALDEHDCFVEPERIDTLLQRLQRDILYLQQGDVADGPLTSQDRSVQVHACHSRMREVEVLHDQLLALFSEDAELQAQDVVVLSPDINEYAPFIEAVFGAAGEGRHIPWSIADRLPEAEHPILAQFLDLLGLMQSRFELSRVVNLLQNPAIGRSLGLDEAELETLLHWLHDSGVRWGRDGEARAQRGLPPFEANSWQFGLRRLLLGYSLPDYGASFAGYSPQRGAQGQQAELLGRLVTFVERLFALQQQCSEPRTLNQWVEVLGAVLDSLFVPVDEAERLSLQHLREALLRMAEEGALAGYEDSIGLTVLQRELQGQLGQGGANHRFLSGQLTFCTMVPMRSIPFKVVCLLGMGDQLYPRRVPGVDFDLMREDVRKGDRSRREDDRFLFLESLLAARQVFYISYVGRSLRDNSPYMPSVVVDELLDYCRRYYRSEQGEIDAQIVTVHPMQAFSEQYELASSPAFSYQSLWFPETVTEAHCFIDRPLAEPEAVAVIQLSDLLSFFRDPVAWFVERRLGLQLPQGDEVSDDHEPFAFERLQRYQIRQSLMQAQMQGQGLETILDMVAHSGQLPPGRKGDLLLRQWQTEVEHLWQAARGCTGEINKTPLELDLELHDIRLQGWLKGYDEQGMVRLRPADLKTHDRISLWLQHLSWCAMHPGRESRAQGVALNYLYGFNPVNASDAVSELQSLIELYRQGQHEPLHFYPVTSWEYRDEKDWGRVKTKWQGNDFAREVQGEGQRLDYRLALAGQEPLDERFEQLAQAIYAPLREYSIKEGKL